MKPFVAYSRDDDESSDEDDTSDDEEEEEVKESKQRSGKDEAGARTQEYPVEYPVEDDDDDPDDEDDEEPDATRPMDLYTLNRYLAKAMSKTCGVDFRLLADRKPEQLKIVKDPTDSDGEQSTATGAKQCHSAPTTAVDADDEEETDSDNEDDDD